MHPFGLQHTHSADTLMRAHTHTHKMNELVNILMLPKEKLEAELSRVLVQYL